MDDRLLLDMTEAEARAARDAARQKELAAINALKVEKTKAAKLEAFKEKKLRSPALPTSGHLLATLSPGVRLAELKVAPAPTLADGKITAGSPPAGGLYQTVPLDGYVRDRKLLEGEGPRSRTMRCPLGKP